MKSGAGDDPFADMSAIEEESSNTSKTEVKDEPKSRTESESSAEDDAGAVDDETTTVDDADDTDDVDIPWVLRRRSVKDDRPNVTQFFLQDETDRAERRFRSDVEELLDTDVYTLDLREAAYVVAMRHPDEVATVLQEWGYEYLD